MKKYFVLLLATFIAFSSCEDIKDNGDSVIQGTIDSVFFRSYDVLGSQNEDGSVTFQGVNDEEVLTLHLRDVALRTYNLGGERPNYATFENAEGKIYRTNPLGDGFVEVTGECASCGWITGSFQFTAVLPGIDTIYVSRGFFYQADYLGEDVDGPADAGTFSAEIEGAAFNPVTVLAVDSGGSILISGATTSNNILIKVPIGVSVGNYTLPELGFQAVYSIGTNSQDASSGNISIITHDTAAKTISGTFSFETPTYSITSGQFNVTYE